MKFRRGNEKICGKRSSNRLSVAFAVSCWSARASRLRVQLSHGYSSTGENLRIDLSGAAVRLRVCGRATARRGGRLGRDASRPRERTKHTHALEIGAERS